MDSEGREGWEEINMKLISHGFRRAGRIGRNYHRTTAWWFSLGTWVSYTNKTDHHDITEILLKVALNTIKT